MLTSTTASLALFACGSSLAEPPANLELGRFRQVEGAKTQRSGRVVSVRLTNLTDVPLRFGMCGRKPDLLVAVPDGDGWKWVHWNWCGNGQAESTLRPGASRSWTLDLAPFQEKYGPRLSFGLGVQAPDRADRKRPDQFHILWSQAVDRSNPPDLQNLDNTKCMK